MKKILGQLILSCLLFSNCKNKQSSFEPVRVKGIPENAFWTGGPDGGNWFVVDSIIINSNAASFRIYNDNSGELIENKIFKLKCDSKIKWDHLQEEISGYDGKIILSNSTQQNNHSCYFE
ncbi:hypothetical protein ACQ33O_12575 [Ferruginibacter sp. SUN002]|uniref:hypothetical protein n=1 Tax=Ferruginibacter sp. SUN002 TaxID=2937789 RepID=UPI003D3670B9